MGGANPPKGFRPKWQNKNKRKEVHRMKKYKIELSELEISCLIELLQKIPAFHITVTKLWDAIRGNKNDN